MNIQWNAEEYKNGFSFVPSYGEDVLKLLTAAPGSRVIDLGCGTGMLTAELKSMGYDVTGIDASEEMLQAAEQAHPDIRFELGDATSLQIDPPADAVFSNAVMHWIDREKQQTALEHISSCLVPGGEFVFEFGGYGCAEAVHSALEEIFREHGKKYLRMFYFPTIGEYAPLVEKAGMRVELAMLFDRPTPQKDGRSVTDWVRMFDTKPFEGIGAEETDEILSEAEKRLKSQLYAGGTWYIDYVRIRMRARKTAARN